MKVALIGKGTIAGFVQEKLANTGHEIGAYLLRADRLAGLLGDDESALSVSAVADLPDDLDLVVGGALQNLIELKP